MDSIESEFKEHGSSERNSKRGLSKIVYREYNESEDKTSLYLLIAKYWEEVFEEDIDRFIWLGQNSGNPYRINNIDVQVYKWTLEDKALIRVAELDDKIIGFMIYHYIFDCFVIVRGIYFLPEYRLKGLMARIVLSLGYVRRVISQTLSKHEPKEIIGEKKSRKLLRDSDGKRVWEYRLDRSIRRNKDESRTRQG